MNLDDPHHKLPAKYTYLLQEVKKYKLGDPRKFHYLNQSNCYEVANVDDAREYLETRNAMDIVGINQDEQVGPQSGD